MQALNKYIIKSEFDFHKSFTTESGLKIQGDVRFLAERLANRHAVIQETPLSHDDEVLRVGTNVLVDPTIFYQQTYEVGGTKQTPHTLDKVKGLYVIEPQLIVLYQDSNSQWSGFGENLLIEMQKETIAAVKVGSIIISDEKTIVSKTLATIKYTNKALKSQRIYNGDAVVIVKGMGVSFWIDSKEYLWINNRHVLAKIG